MGKAKLLLIISIYLIMLPGCSKSPGPDTTSTMITPAVTRISTPVTPSITPTPIQTSLAAQNTRAAFLPKVKPESVPTSTATPPSPLKEKLSEIHFPTWVSDPAANVLMLPTGSLEDGYTHQSGELTPLRIDAVTEKYANFESFYEAPEQVNSFWAPDTANGFFLSRMHQNVSPNGRYLVEETSDNHTMVTNLSTGEQQAVSPEDANFDLFVDWNPAQPDQLAIQQSDVEMGMLYSFYTPPRLRIKIVNVETGRSTNFIKGVFGAYSGMWSPDGRQLLYYQKLPTEVGLGKGNPPCLFDLINETSRCFNQLVALHGVDGDMENYTWSPTGKYLSYFYDGGLCLFNLSDEKETCFLQKLDHEEEVIRFKWSPDERYIAFQYDESCPACDFSTLPKIGILDIHSGSYGYVSDMIAEQMGAWRPPVQANNP
jgi:WD40 repeat protein